MRMRVEELPVEMTRTGDERVPRRILAVFDGSPGAWTALERAIRIAERERALLTIAAVVPEPSFWVGTGLVSVPYTREGLRADAVRAMERELAAARDEVPATVSLTTRLLPGRPRGALRRLERSGNFDLVIAPGRRRRRRHVRSPQASSRSPASVLAMKPT
jgi:nucleotide-binding universal stress UspA family protein